MRKIFRIWVESGKRVQQELYDYGGFMGRLLFFIFLALILQRVFTYFQMKDFRQNAAQLRKVGRIGAGTVKRRFGAGAIVLLAADTNEIVIDGRILQGMSVFAKFQPYTQYNGSKLINIMNDTEKKLETAEGKDVARLKATFEAAKMIYDSFRDERGASETDAFDELGDEEVVDAVISDEMADDINENYDEFENLEEIEEPQIIDVEEIEEVKEP